MRDFAFACHNVTRSSKTRAALLSLVHAEAPALHADDLGVVQESVEDYSGNGSLMRLAPATGKAKERV